MDDKEKFEQAWDEQTIEAIKNDPTYKQVLADSFGGVMYNVANRDKYNSSMILNMWDTLSPAHKESVGGIMKGAINFLKEDF